MVIYIKIISIVLHKSLPKIINFRNLYAIAFQRTVLSFFLFKKMVLLNLYVVNFTMIVQC